MNGPLILVVDDQAGVRLLLREVFREIGYRVALAAHGQEAVVMASVEMPSLALVDLKMPVMDGLETLRALKELDPALPVMMMTAVGEGRVSEMLANGARDCITKPFDVFALRDLVQQVLQEEGRV
jgi:two-component system response regulator (stage 0 sporulation protein F)